MNEFENALSGYYTTHQLQKIQGTKIGIAGAGGLGSNIAVCLARSGFKIFEIIDFDIIETKNLNRQYYFLNEVGKPKVEALAARLSQINPDIEITAREIKLHHGNISEYFIDSDVIFEAFDNIDSKKLIFEAFGNSGKILVFGNGMAGIRNKEIKIRKIGNNAYIVGDQETQVERNAPPLSPRVTACAAMMASVALENILISNHK